MRALSPTTLSPWSADIGMATMLQSGNRAANFAKSSAMSRNRRSSKFDQIHLVHGEDELANAEQRTQKAMPPRLLQEPLPGIDQEDREIRGRRPSHHVARIVLVTGRVGDDEPPPRRAEITIGDVDGDALFAFGFKAVHQQCRIKVARHSAMRPGIARQRGELIVENQRRIEQEPADQRRLAVVDRTAGEHAELVARRPRTGMAARPPRRRQTDQK